MNDLQRGKVYLVGAGPGDPKLITMRGAELIAQADVIVNDRLANPRLLKLARADADIIYVGKASRDHTLPQEEIIRTIIDLANEGKNVVRLKGGDPFVFGRGGEEAEALANAGIEFEVVPGISSAIAAAAYAGIPVTHRSLSASMGIVTGHEAAGKQDSDIKWDKISTGLDTLVFLMGVENLANIVRKLVDNGRPPNTPAAVIQWGTHPVQRTVTGTLADIVALVKQSEITPPAITVVGDVVGMRHTIAWFEKRPLFGRRIVVTRAESSGDSLSVSLLELGAQVDEYPVIKFIAPPDYAIIDAAICDIDSFDWILFTSANGVEWFFRRLFDTGYDIRALGNAKLAAIGPKTADVLLAKGLRVEYMPSKYVAETVVGEFPADIANRKILIPRALEAREELPAGLRDLGADVTVAPVYQTITDDSAADTLREHIRNEIVDMVTFTSASTVDNFFDIIGDIVLGDDVAAACIGPITAQAARRRGLTNILMASEYTIEGLVDCITTYYNGNGKSI
jgi:uroporphyrinogen III methyltransferase/synthase